MPVRRVLNTSLLQIAKRVVAVSIAASVMFVAACGDGGSDGGSGSTSVGGSTLSLSGTPPSQVMQGSQLNFAPNISNPNNVSLTFTATNLPSWASINPSTGRITGTPSSADVGTYTGISITVSGGGESFTSPSYSIMVVATAAGSATLTWTPPTQYTDGASLVIDHYNLYVAGSQSALGGATPITVGAGQTSHTVVQLSTGQTWYFAITAVDASNIESVFSNIAQKAL